MDGKTIAESKRLLTYKQVAEMLAVDVQTVRRLRARGKLRAVGITRQIVRFRPEEVERFLQKAGR